MLQLTKCSFHEIFFRELIVSGNFRWTGERLESSCNDVSFSLPSFSLHVVCSTFITKVCSTVWTHRGTFPFSRLCDLRWINPTVDSRIIMDNIILTTIIEISVRGYHPPQSWTIIRNSITSCSGRTWPWWLLPSTSSCRNSHSYHIRRVIGHVSRWFIRSNSKWLPPA